MNSSVHRNCAALLMFFLFTFLASCGKQPSDEAGLLRGDQFDGIRTLIHQTMERRNIASIAVAVSQNGKIIWEEAFGWADRDKKVKATPHTIYPLASVSKSITATGLMILTERGLVDLGRPANDYLGPSKLVAYVGKDSGATVRRVLLHTAGLPMYWNIFFEDEKAHPPPMDETIRKYGILVSEPGEMFNYSNLGYGIIGHIISRVSGKSFEDFMKSELFDPLGLERTSVLINPAMREDVALLYDEMGSRVPYWDCDHRGASSVYSSAHDLVRFGMFHLKNHLQDQRQVLSDGTLDAMHQQTGIKLPDVKIGSTESGLGWAIVDLYGYRILSATGGAPGVVTRLGLVPSENITVAILCNSGISETPDQWNLWNIEWKIFAALIPKLPKGIDTPLKVPQYSPFPEELKGEWAGIVKTYSADLNTRMSFKEKEGVVLDIQGKVTRPIDVDNPLGTINYTDGILQGPFFAGIKTDDTKRSPTVMFLYMKFRGDRLNGSASAIATDQKFCLPNWIDLTKVAGKPLQ